MIYDLPTSVELNGKKYEIRADFRDILNICLMLTDPELTQEEKTIGILVAFYKDYEDIPEELYEDAIKECFKFINMGEEDSQNRKAPKLMDWEQDFQYIVAPINRVIGTEIRVLPFLHWWTFIGAYYEIGDCTFAQIVRIRDLKHKGKTLDSVDKEWYRDHRDMVDIKTKYTDAEKDLLKQWGV